MKIFFIILPLLASSIACNAQNKKEQIEKLTFSLDSLRAEQKLNIEIFNARQDSLNAIIELTQRSVKEKEDLIANYRKSINDQSILIDSLSAKCQKLNESLNLISMNKELLIPQEIEYDGKPDIDYEIEGKICVLDIYEKGIRMKFVNNELTLFKVIETEYYRDYKGGEYTVIVAIDKFGELGEGYIQVSGNLVIMNKGQIHKVSFSGSEYERISGRN